MVTHGFDLLDGDREGLAFVYGSWFAGGPALRYQLTTGGGRGGMAFPTYADLMTASDGTGRNRSYLATEDNFRFLKDRAHSSDPSLAAAGSSWTSRPSDRRWPSDATIGGDDMTESPAATTTELNRPLER